MSRNKNKKPQPILTDLAITQIAAEGKTIARHPDGRVIFVEGGVPGDVRITTRYHEHDLAFVVAVNGNSLITLNKPPTNNN